MVLLSDDALRLVLEDWNFWGRSIPEELTGHPRKLTQRVREIATGREVVAIIGPRRCGKTTILYQLMDELLRSGTDSRSILVVNLEDHRFAFHHEAQLLDQILFFYRQEIDPTGPAYLFLDEPQEIEGWERWVRSLYDRQPGIRMFVTGSSSTLMASELSTLLTGRNLTCVASPFSFAEYLSFRGVEVTCASDPGTAYKENLASRELLAHHLTQYLELGGFPEALKSGSSLRR